MNHQLVDATRIAKRLGLSRFTVLALARRNRIPAVRITQRLVRFDEHAVLRAIGVPQTANLVGPGGDDHGGDAAAAVSVSQGGG